MDLASSGRLNRYIGWILLITGFACATLLDPWSLSERDPSVLVGSPRTALRHAQAAVIGMAFLQLAVAHMLTASALPYRARGSSACLTAFGALVYVGGYVLASLWPAGAWLIPAGALMNLAGFMTLSWVVPAGRGTPGLRVVLAVFCFGMLLDAMMGLFASSPGTFLPTYIGPEDGVRLRMLRLARAAVIALSVLTLLYQGLAARGDPHRRAIRWGRLGMLCGTIGMPTILTAACFTTVSMKFLLPIPAQAIFAGTLVGVWLAQKYSRPLELWGWLLIATSMASGLLMGMYAFDGPLPSPEFLGAYNDFARRLARLAHAYCIVLGLLSIFIARELDSGCDGGVARWIGLRLLVAGSAATMGVILVQAAMDLPLSVLRLGPASVAVATALCIAPVGTRP